MLYKWSVSNELLLTYSTFYRLLIVFSASMRESVYVKSIHCFELKWAKPAGYRTGALVYLVVKPFRAFLRDRFEAEPALLVLERVVGAHVRRAFVIAFNGAKMTIKVRPGVEIFVAFFALVLLMITQMFVKVVKPFVTDGAGLLDGFLGLCEPFLIISVYISHVVYHFSESDKSFVTMFAFRRVIYIELRHVVILVLSIPSQCVELLFAVNTPVVANRAMVNLVSRKSILVFENSEAIITDNFLLACGALLVHYDAVLRAQVAV